MPDQASCVESGDRRGSMDARAGGYVEHCAGSSSKHRCFVAPEGRV